MVSVRPSRVAAGAEVAFFLVHRVLRGHHGPRRCAGRDPKPWPPPFKLNREMVDAMGGADSEPYRRFRAYACEAYNILRKRAPAMILALQGFQ